METKRTAERKGSVSVNFIDEELNIIEQKEHEEVQQQEQQRLKLKEKEKRMNKAEKQKDVESVQGVEVVASMDDGATVDSHIVDQQAPMTEGPLEGEAENRRTHWKRNHQRSRPRTLVVVELL